MMASRFLPRHWIPRSVHEPGGIGYILRTGNGRAPLDIPRDVAGWWSCAGEYEPVTWRQIKEQRAAAQREHLAQLLRPSTPVIRPAQVWVFFVPGWLYAGWWCYIRTLRGDVSSGGFKDDVGRNSWLALHLMKIIPLGVLPDAENWEMWKEAFAKAYPKPPTKNDPRKAGYLNGWTDGRTFQLTKDLL